MADFGTIPKGTGFGLVPTFPFRLPDVKSGPKALYASLCSNASPKGIVWRSLAKLAQEFKASKRQLQRWVNDLEQAGLLVRVGWEGKSIRFLVIRDQAGQQWAKAQFVKNALDRRAVAVPHARAGHQARWPKPATSVSLEPDVDVVKGATPMSPKHNLPNNTILTGKGARQEEAGGPSGASRGQVWGLKRLGQSKRAEEVQNAINALADSLGWEVMCVMPPEAIAADLFRTLDVKLTPAEVRAFLNPSGVPESPPG